MDEKEYQTNLLILNRQRERPTLKVMLSIFSTMINMEDREIYEAIWEELKLIGYQEGDDVLYFHFIEACDYSNVNYFDINIEEFEEVIGVTVG